MTIERHNLVRAHEWIRLFPPRRLCGQDEYGVYWDDERDSTHLHLWADVECDLADTKRRKTHA